MILGEDLHLRCDEEIMGECTVEVKDIHIQGKQKKKKERKNEIQIIIEFLSILMLTTLIYVFSSFFSQIIHLKCTFTVIT